MDLPLGALVRESAADVHAELCGGLSECVYQTALAIALRQRGCLVETEVVVPVTYKNSYVGFLRPDLVIDKRVVIETKAVQKVAESHVAQTRAYLRWMPPVLEEDGTPGRVFGIVVNFGPTAVEMLPVEPRVAAHAIG